MNNIMVVIKVAIIVISIAAGLAFVDTSNWRPYLPQKHRRVSATFGWSGVRDGRGDHLLRLHRLRHRRPPLLQEARTRSATCRSASSARSRSRRCCTVAMAAVMTGMVSYTQLDVAAPVAVAPRRSTRRCSWLGLPVKGRRHFGMTSVVLMVHPRQPPAIFMAMSRDGLLPPALQKVHPKHQRPTSAR